LKCNRLVAIIESPIQKNKKEQKSNPLRIETFQLKKTVLPLLKETFQFSWWVEKWKMVQRGKQFIKLIFVQETQINQCQFFSRRRFKLSGICWPAESS